jgi:hypothetical protein
MAQKHDTVVSILIFSGQEIIQWQALPVHTTMHELPYPMR